MTPPRPLPPQGAPGLAPAGALLAVLLAAGLGACSPSSRFGGFGDQPRVAYAAPAPLAPAPTARVTTERLPPPGPAYGAARPSGPVSSLPIEPGAPEPLPGAPPAGEFVAPAAPKPVVTARREPVRPIEPAAPAGGPPTRTSVIGNYTAKEASGSSCKLTLSSASSLDLSKATTSGCGAGLQKVNAWEQRGDEVVLYEPGGAVAARLKSAPGRGFEGTSTKSGAPISLSK